MPLSLLDLPFYTEVLLIYCLKKKMVLGAEWLLNEKLIFFKCRKTARRGERKSGAGKNSRGMATCLLSSLLEQPWLSVPQLMELIAVFLFWVVSLLPGHLQPC